MSDQEKQTEDRNNGKRGITMAPADTRMTVRGDSEQLFANSLKNLHEQTSRKKNTVDP